MEGLEVDSLGQELDHPERLTSLSMSGLMDVRDDEVLERLTQLACRALGVPVALVSLVDDHQQRFPAQTGLPAPWSIEAGTPLSHSFCQHVVTSGAPLVIDDATTDLRVEGNEAMVDLDVKAYAGFPLRDADGLCLGSFCAIDDTAHQWSEAELETIADLAAVVESDLRARMALRRSAARIDLLGDLTAALQIELDADATLATLGQRVVPALADLCVIDLLDPASGVLRGALVTATDPRLAESERRSPGALDPASPVRRVLRTGRSAVIGPDEVAPAAHAGMGIRAAVVTPIPARSDVIGVLTLARTVGSVGFDGDDVALIEEVARRVGVAIVNAEAYGREHDTALALQRWLLPQVADAEGLSVAVRYQPSGHSAQVGGDWYDLLQLPTGALGLAVGDVSGHDMAAAASMGQLRAVLRSYAWDGAEPSDVLSSMCRMVRGLDQEQMATAFYGRLAPPGPDGSRTLDYSCAGHPAPYLVLPDRSVERLEGALAPLIGVETVPRPQASVEVPPGATLVCFTDGLVERRREGPEAGLETLAGTLVERAGAPVDDIAEALLAALTPAGGWEDDVALLVVRSEGGPTSAAIPG